ncbi:MAG: hypothetical protein HY001_01805 [Candidatus Portnoybacteria bacterium]|nr:hypothetical protein [Candidatus Portnoybacteria bacterium]
MMSEAIKNFAKQFSFEPKVENAGKLTRLDKFIVCGMGGSPLGAQLLKAWNPRLDIVIHKDYGLPAMGEKKLRERLIIASSYSGNTEETLDAFNEAIKKKLPVAALSIGGKLLELAKKYAMPYVQMPDTGIQPRSSLGFQVRALLKMMGDEDGFAQAGKLATSLNPSSFENAGKTLANELRGNVPVIYASTRNLPIAYNWKIKCNETGKIPAFYNVFPELNHNEMIGFDVKDASRALSEKFYFILLRDAQDHPQIQKRMEVLKKLYEDRGLRVKTLPLEGKTTFEKIFSSLVLADWTAYYTGESYGLETDEVPMVEEFKKLIL